MADLQITIEGIAINIINIGVGVRQNILNLLATAGFEAQPDKNGKLTLSPSVSLASDDGIVVVTTPSAPTDARTILTIDKILRLIISRPQELIGKRLEIIRSDGLPINVRIKSVIWFGNDFELWCDDSNSRSVIRLLNLLEGNPQVRLYDE